MARAPHGHGGGKLLEVKRAKRVARSGKRRKRAKSEREKKGGQPWKSKELLGRLGTYK